VHLEVRIPLQSIDGDERRAIPRGEPLFRAAIAPNFPGRANQLRELLVGDTTAQRTPQVRAV
jgi:hypothetical protein